MIDKNLFIINLKESLKELGLVFKDFFPKNIKEVTLLVLMFLFYFSFGWIIANETCIQDCLVKRYDVYLNFDSGARFHGVPFGLDVAHPLFNLYSTPISLVLEFLVNFFGNYKIKTIGFAMICNLMVSLSVVYVYRYLVEIVKVKNTYVAYLFVFFYSFSFTCLVLSFTVETYPFSIFFLSFLVYCYSKQMQNGGQFKFLTNFCFCFVMGGITITNTAKSMIPIFFLKEKFSKNLKQVFIIGCVLLVCFAVALYGDRTYELFLLRLEVSVPLEVSYWVGWEFLSTGCVLFPPIISLQEILPKEIAVLSGIPYKDYFLYQIQVIPFSLVWEHVYTVFLSIVIFVPLFCDYRNKLVQMLYLLFSIEIILHLIISYGMFETYLYGGHWIYILPLLCGWAYKSLHSWKKYTFLGLVSCLFVCTIITNAMRLIDFIEVSKIVWPLESYKW